MNGVQEYTSKINNKIKNVLEGNPDKTYLKGFRYFINNLSPTTIYEYVSIVNAFMDSNGKDPKDLNLDDYTIYTGEMSDNTPSYRILTHSALKKFSRYLMASQINPLDPMQYIDRPSAKERAETIEKRAKGYLNKREIHNLKKSIENGVGTKKAKDAQNTERDMAMIMILLTTGIRCSALCKLDIDDVNEMNHTITVTDKGNKVTEIKLSDETWNILVTWLTVRPKTDDVALFTNRFNKRISYRSTYTLVKKYGNVSPHKLRATYGTQLYNSTKDIVFVQNCMGHASPTTTRLYIRGEVNNTDRASEIMNGLIS